MVDRGYNHSSGYFANEINVSWWLCVTDNKSRANCVGSLPPGYPGFYCPPNKGIKLYRVFFSSSRIRIIRQFVSLLRVLLNDNLVGWLAIYFSSPASSGFPPRIDHAKNRFGYLRFSRNLRLFVDGN